MFSRCYSTIKQNLIPFLKDHSVCYTNHTPCIALLKVSNSYICIYECSTVKCDDFSEITINTLNIPSSMMSLILKEDFISFCSQAYQRGYTTIHLNSLDEGSKWCTFPIEKESMLKDIAIEYGLLQLGE